MGSTHLCLYYHLVFGTKDHVPFIDAAWRERLHAFVGGTIRTMDGVAEAVGGVSDHVHLLVGLKATHVLADVLREMKSVSSSWIHREVGAKRFEWQEGYGAFTVSHSQRDKVSAYIRNQEEHHKTKTFREEYITLLTKNGVPFDERYI